MIKHLGSPENINKWYKGTNTEWDKIKDQWCLDLFIDELVNTNRFTRIDSIERIQIRGLYYRLLPAFLDPFKPVITKYGSKLSNGFNRVVIGDYGAYIEFEDTDKNLIPAIAAKTGRFGNAVLPWYNKNATDDTKIYVPKNSVSWGDFVPGLCYISVYDIKTYPPSVEVVKDYDEYSRWRNDQTYVNLEDVPEHDSDLHITGYSPEPRDDSYYFWYNYDIPTPFYIMPFDNTLNETSKGITPSTDGSFYKFIDNYTAIGNSAEYGEAITKSSQFFYGNILTESSYTICLNVKLWKTVPGSQELLLQIDCLYPTEVDTCKAMYSTAMGSESNIVCGFIPGGYSSIVNESFTPSVFIDNEWHRLAITVRRTGVYGLELGYYIDGILKVSTGRAISTKNGRNFGVGFRNWWNVANCYINNMKIYNTVLDTKQIEGECLFNKYI